MQSDKLELPNGSCLVSNIQDYFDYITRKYETLTNKAPARTSANQQI